MTANPPTSYNKQMTSQLAFNHETLFILDRLTQAGHEAYLVGGTVRDLLLETKKRQPNEVAQLSPLVDQDIATDAKPEEIMQLFPEAFYENKFGTVSLSYEHLWQSMQVTSTYQQNFYQNNKRFFESKRKGKIIDLKKATKIHSSLTTKKIKQSQKQETISSEPIQAKWNKSLPLFELTTFRSQEEYVNSHRRPSSLSWGESIEEDLERRDFTINAIALKLDESALTSWKKQFTLAKVDRQAVVLPYQLIDQHQGLDDLEQHLIRTVGQPSERFQEDALRMLRAIRFSVQLNFQIEPATLKAISHQAHLIQHISWERIRDEFLKMLTSAQPQKAIVLMDRTHLLSYILPELIKTKGVEQAGHHTTDVWTHSLAALQTCPSNDALVKLAALLHDIAKPQTQKIDQSGHISFYNHEVIGARVAKKIGQRLRLSKKEQNRLFTLVRFHMFHYQPQNSDASVRRFMRQVGLENIDDILDLREGDRLGSGAKKTSWRLEEFKQRMTAQLNQPMSITDLAIDGHNLIEKFNLTPGRKIGQVLQQLFQQVLEDPTLNKKELLLKQAQKILAKSS